MDQGVQLMDPCSDLTCAATWRLAAASRSTSTSIFEGEVTILGDDVAIGPNCLITDSLVGAGSVIKANSVLEQVDRRRALLP